MLPILLLRLGAFQEMNTYARPASQAHGSANITAHVSQTYSGTSVGCSSSFRVTYRTVLLYFIELR